MSQGSNHLEVRAQLERILASPGFQGAQRRSKLLRYLVEQALDGPEGALKESVIATEVFDRAPDYDPQVDSIVRVEVGRLRSRLAEYYGQAGDGEAVRIEIPKGGYRPVFVVREEPEAMPAPIEPASPPKPKSFLRGHPRESAAAGILVVALLGLLAWAGSVGKQEPVASIAILPFLNLSGDPGNEYLGDGISEEVTEALAQFSRLRVVSRTSAFQFKGKNEDIREIGRRLGASAIVEGSVGLRGGQWHIVAQLIRTGDGYHIWSDAYDGPAGDIPSVEMRIAESVRAHLVPNEPRRPAPPAKPESAHNAEAHDLYLRAAFAFNKRTVDSVRTAKSLAEQAAAKDPAYAEPYLLMAATESELTTLLAAQPHDAAGRARADIAKALELDPGNSAALGQKALLDYTDAWNWPEAEREFRLALASGSHGSVENLYGWSLMTRGRFAEARQHLQTAAELDPLSLGPQLNQVEELVFEGRLLAAREKSDAILAAAPSNPVALAQRSAIADYQHDCPAATKVSGRLMQQYPMLPFSQMASMGASVACGRKDEAEAKFQNFLRSNASQQVAAYSLAEVYAIRGDTDQSISYLEKAAELREPPILYMRLDRLLDRLRGDARFIALERRAGLLD